MNNIWLCTPVLFITLVFSDQIIDINHIRAFPGLNQTIAGVFQVSYLNDLDQPEYAFNASEARTLCMSLGVTIASKAQVEKALTRGLETCRFGWIDEHFAVIPRIRALANCGQNQTGLVPWRASVKQNFDVFCFNESDAATQWEDTATDSPLNSSYYSGHTQSPSKATNSTRTTDSSSSSSSPETTDSEGEPARFVGSTQGSSGGKTVLITCTSALLLIAVITLTYLKLRRRCSQSSDMKQQPEYIQTEEWVCVKNVKETKKGARQDERIEVDDKQ